MLALLCLVGAVGSLIASLVTHKIANNELEKYDEQARQQLDDFSDRLENGDHAGPEVQREDYVIHLRRASKAEGARAVFGIMAPLLAITAAINRFNRNFYRSRA